MEDEILCMTCWQPKNECECDSFEEMEEDEYHGDDERVWGYDGDAL